MTPFQRAELPPEAFDVAAVMAKTGANETQAQHLIAELREQDVYVNDLYQVNITRAPVAEGWPAMWHLSIKRRDKKAVHHWRDFQQIKNMLVGPEHEAVELYPAEERLVDTANQYHLWVLMHWTDRFPFGFIGRELGTPEEAEKIGAKQARIKG